MSSLLGLLNSLILFCGGGVMTHGLNLGRTWAIDGSLIARACYELNHPGAIVLDGDLLKDRPEDVLCGSGIRHLELLQASPPCPCWSSAGNQRKGQSSLEHHPTRFLLYSPLPYIRLLRPEFIAIENVRGLIHRKPGPLWLDVLVKEIQLLGYSMPENGYWMENLADLGAFQCRRRIFIVARRERGMFPPPPAHTHRNPDLDGKLPTWRTMGEAIGDLTEVEALSEGLEPMTPGRVEKLATIMPGAFYDQKATGGTYKRRPRMDRPSYPLPTNPSIGKTSIPHPLRHRHLSVVEYKRLFGADDYRWPLCLSVDDRYRVLGNGNPSEQFVMILRQLMR